jgi:flagellar P-ring protein precursor FlgI
MKIIGVLLLFVLSFPIQADRLKDLASVQGVRTNQLVGYGLVVGLDGTGDQTSQTPFTIQTFKNMMAQFGIAIPNNINPQLKNVAAVSIHAELPAFAKVGQTIDVTISSLGNAKSLRGGSLLMTPLRGADGQVYALSQGNLVVGGFGAEGSDGSSIKVNVPSVGRIPNGASIERELPSSFANSDFLTFNLHQSDFTTAKRVTDSINRLLGSATAQALDATSIRVSAPQDASQRVTFLSVLENLDIAPAEAAAKIIINSRTGTIVIGQNVRVSPAAVTHGSLTVTISENAEVSQPNALAAGETVVVPQSDVSIDEEKSRMFVFKPGVSLDEIVRAVNQVGAAPGDLMAILEALKQSGALRAEIVVI